MARLLDVVVSGKFGLNPLPLACPLCGEPNGYEEAVGVLYRHECSVCAKTIFFKEPVILFPCSVCGKGRFKNMGEQNTSITLTLSTFLCKACEDIVTKITKEVARGGLSWHCSDCNAYGSLSADSDFTKTFRKLYKTTEVDFTGTGKCPNCGEGV